MIMYVTRGEGVKKSEKFADVIAQSEHTVYRQFCFRLNFPTSLRRTKERTSLLLKASEADCEEEELIFKGEKRRGGSKRRRWISSERGLERLQRKVDFVSKTRKNSHSLTRKF